MYIQNLDWEFAKSNEMGGRLVVNRIFVSMHIVNDRRIVIPKDESVRARAVF